MCTEKIYNRFMKNALGSIAILGSGETSPNLVSVHRELLEILDNSSDAYMIDTPFGFQENANQLVEKIIEFYKVSLNVEMKLASYRKIEELNTKSFFKSIQLLENASFIFAVIGDSVPLSFLALHPKSKPTRSSILNGPMLIPKFSSAEST